MLTLPDILQDQSIQIYAPPEALCALLPLMPPNDYRMKKEEVMKLGMVKIGTRWEREEIEMSEDSEVGFSRRDVKEGQYWIDQDSVERRAQEAKNIFETLAQLGITAVMSVESLNPVHGGVYFAVSEKLLKENASEFGGVRKVQHLINFGKTWRETMEVKDLEESILDLMIVYKKMEEKKNNEFLEALLNSIEELESAEQRKHWKEMGIGFEAEEALRFSVLKKIKAFEVQDPEAPCWMDLEKGALAVKALQQASYGRRYQNKAEQEKRLRTVNPAMITELFNASWHGASLANVLLKKEYLSDIIFESAILFDWAKKCNNFGKNAYTHFMLEHLLPTRAPLSFLRASREFLQEHHELLPSETQKRVHRFFKEMQERIAKKLKELPSGSEEYSEWEKEALGIQMCLHAPKKEKGVVQNRSLRL